MWKQGVSCPNSFQQYAFDVVYISSLWSARALTLCPRIKSYTASLVSECGKDQLDLAKSSCASAWYNSSHTILHVMSQFVCMFEPFLLFKNLKACSPRGFAAEKSLATCQQLEYSGINF